MHCTQGILTKLNCYNMESLSSSPESNSFLDSKDEVKKKVTFAMSNSASAESVASIGSGVSINNGINNNNSKDDILLLTPGQEILFSNSPVGDLVAKLQIQNVSAKPVGYKIKTTSPEKYRVRPSTGQLGPGATASVEIHCSGADMPEDFHLVMELLTHGQKRTVVQYEFEYLEPRV